MAGRYTTAKRNRAATRAAQMQNEARESVVLALSLMSELATRAAQMQNEARESVVLALSLMSELTEHLSSARKRLLALERLAKQA